MSYELEAIAILLGLEHVGVSTLLIPPIIPLNDFNALVARSGISHLFVPPLFWKSHEHFLEPYLPVAVMGSNFQYVTIRQQEVLDCSVFGNEACVCQMTSGTTSSFSKLAVRTWSSVMFEIQENQKQIQFTNNDCLFVCSAISHSYAFVGLLTALLASSSIIMSSPNIGISTTWNTSIYPTVIYGNRSFYESIPSDAAIGFPWLRCTRTLLTAGAPISAKLRKDVFSRSGVALHNEYGCTESGVIAGTFRADTTSDDPLLCGKIMEYYQVKILESPYTKHFVGTNVGELCFKSPSIAIGYVLNGKLEPCTDSEGWYRTGDIVKLLSDRSVSVQARKLPAIKVGDEKWPPAMVEAKLMQGVKGVKEACVVPGEDGSVLVIVTKDLNVPLEEQHIREWITENLSPDFPEISVKFNQIPRSPAGKILYYKCK